MALLVALIAIGTGIFFTHFDEAVDMDRVKACCYEGVGLALIAIDDSTDGFILVDMSQIYWLIVGFASLMANIAQLFCFLFILLFFWVFYNS